MSTFSWAYSARLSTTVWQSVCILREMLWFVRSANGFRFTTCSGQLGRNVSVFVAPRTFASPVTKLFEHRFLVGHRCCGWFKALPNASSTFVGVVAWSISSSTTLDLLWVLLWSMLLSATLGDFAFFIFFAPDLFQPKMSPTLSFSGMYRKSFIHRRNRTNSQ